MQHIFVGMESTFCGPIALNLESNLTLGLEFKVDPAKLVHGYGESRMEIIAGDHEGRKGKGEGNRAAPPSYAKVVVAGQALTRSR